MNWLDKAVVTLAERLAKLDKSFWHDCTCFAGVVFLALFFGWLLSLAYPEGLVDEDTATYWAIVKNFSWVSVNQMDWLRTVPYGALMDFASKCSSPTGLLYWINTVIFALNCGLIFVLGRLLFGTARRAIALAVSTLLFEVVNLRSFYVNLQLTADPLVAQLIFFGVLLSLTAWLTQKRWLFIAAYAVFGYSTFIKPVAVFLFPLWIPLAFLFWNRRDEQALKRWLTTAASVAVLILPAALWSLRNYFVYGYAKGWALAGVSLLLANLPLMTSQDRIFDDARASQDFIVLLRSYESSFRVRSEQASAESRLPGLYERYFLLGQANNPFQVLAKVANPDWQLSSERRPISWGGRQLFMMDNTAWSAALRLIQAHPWDYLDRVGRAYVKLFTPSAFTTNAADSFQSDPVSSYRYWDLDWGPRSLDYKLFPGKGRPDVSKCNRAAAALLDALHNNLIAQLLLNSYYAFEFFISHLIFLIALLLYARGHKSNNDAAKVEPANRMAVVLMVLFLTAASLYGGCAVFQLTRLRYVLSGELELHLLFIIALLSVLLRGNYARHIQAKD